MTLAHESFSVFSLSSSKNLQCTCKRAYSLILLTYSNLQLRELMRLTTSISLILQPREKTCGPEEVEGLACETGLQKSQSLLQNGSCIHRIHSSHFTDGPNEANNRRLLNKLPRDVLGILLVRKASHWFFKRTRAYEWSFLYKLPIGLSQKVQPYKHPQLEEINSAF